MIIRTAKDTFSASTFAALAAHQQELQGAFASIEIGEYTVDVSASDDTAENYARMVLEELTDAIDRLAVEAGMAGDTEMVRLCAGARFCNVPALEACCAALCDAAAQD